MISSKQESTCVQCDQPAKSHACCVTTYRRERIIERVSYDEWLPNVRILAPDTPDTILLDFIRRGCIEFAKKTGILTRNIQLEVQDCVSDYYPCLGTEETINDIRMLSVNGNCYQSVGDTCDWDVGNHKFWYHPPATLEIHPAPKGGNCGDVVILTVKAQPSEKSSTVDKIIYDRHFEAIEHYAVAKAHLIPEMPATAGEAHVYRLNEFKKAVNSAKIDIVRNYANDLKSPFNNGGCSNGRMF